MSISVLILGESGTGKTTSLRNFDGEKVALIQAVSKPLPFRPKGWKPFVSDRFDKILSAMRKAADKGYKVIVIDDFQYVLSNEFMARAYENGFGKFTEIGRHGWEILREAGNLPDDVRVYILNHIATDEFGNQKMKTIGKLLDEKITPEGMFTIVLRTAVIDGDYRFRTTNSGQDTVKAPMGMFNDCELIPNDLKMVDDTIRDYYEISTGE